MTGQFYSISFVQRRKSGHGKAEYWSQRGRGCLQVPKNWSAPALQGFSHIAHSALCVLPAFRDCLAFSPSLSPIYNKTFCSYCQSGNACTRLGPLLYPSMGLLPPTLFVFCLIW